MLSSQRPVGTPFLAQLQQAIPETTLYWYRHPDRIEITTLLRPSPISIIN